MIDIMRGFFRQSTRTVQDPASVARSEPSSPTPSLTTAMRASLTALPRAETAAEVDERDFEEASAATPEGEARRRERARCLAIMQHPAAVQSLGLALALMKAHVGRHEACAIQAGTLAGPDAKPHDPWAGFIADHHAAASKAAVPGGRVH